MDQFVDCVVNIRLYLATSRYQSLFDPNGGVKLEIACQHTLGPGGDYVEGLNRWEWSYRRLCSV